MAIYNGSTPTYAHGDWLGSGRLITSSTQMMVADSAYAPFGEQYAATGSLYDFTGQEQWTTAGLDDFLFRRYHPVQGRFSRRHGVGGKLPCCLEARLEGAGLLSNRFRSYGAFCHRTYIRLSPDKSRMGSGRAACLNALNSFRRARVYPDLLGFL
jgi:hypothetical protein